MVSFNVEWWWTFSYFCFVSFWYATLRVWIDSIEKKEGGDRVVDGKKIVGGVSFFPVFEETLYGSICQSGAV